MMNIAYIAMGVAGVFVFLMITLIVLCFMLIRKLSNSSCNDTVMENTVSLPVSVPEKRKSRLAHLLPKNE